MSDPQATQNIYSVGMGAKEKAEFIKLRIELAIKELSESRDRNRRRASIVKVCTILLSSFATILLGLQIVGWGDQFRNIAFTLGAMVTLLNALEPFFNFRDLWVEHEAALGRMYRLENDIDFFMAGVNPEELNLDKLQEFLNVYKDIWDTLNQNYIRYRRGEPSH